MASVIAAQMYTIRDFCKDAAGIAQSCAKLKQIGYQNVQISGIAALPAAEMAKILEGEGLACVATHKGLDDMKDVNAIVDYHATLKCRYTAIGGWGWKSGDKAAWEAFAVEYSQLAKTLKAKGLEIGYHNHSHELASLPGEKSLRPMHVLIQKCDPAVWFEIDTYWIQHGGGDPAAWIDQVAGRIPCVHFKDMCISHDRQQKMCEVGGGNLNWPRILEACKKAGVKHYIVERDAGDLDPFESLKISFENLRAMGLN